MKILLFISILICSSSASLKNYKCKNASSDWPSCVSPQSSYKLRFGEGNNFPITAWWGPVGYGGNDTSKEFQAYVDANFTIALVSDRGSDRCTGHTERDSKDSWNFIVDQLNACEKAGIQGIVDTYRCTPWFNTQTYGGASQGTSNGYVTRTFNHKITLPEVQMLAKELVKIENAVGLLVTDDGVDLKQNEIEEIQWMRENTPELFPWVNQCGDGSEWLARAGTPYAVPELYSVKGPTGNASSMASSLLGTFDDWSSKSRRYDLKFWPLINVGDGGDTGFVRSKSLVRFSAFSSLAFNAKGLNWYCWGRGIYNLTSDEPSEIYDEVKHVNTKILSWADAILRHENFQGTFETGTNVTAPRSKKPSNDSFIHSMSDDLLVGVMTNRSGDVLLIVVDKRVDISLNGGGEARDIELVLYSGKVLNAILLPGDGAMFEIQDEQGLSSQLRDWRNDGSLNSVRTTQYSFYNFAYKALPQTAFPIMRHVVNGDSSMISDLANMGYNSVLRSDVSQSWLNEGLRHGIFVFGQNSKALSDFSCHPNLGGFVLSDFDAHEVDNLRQDASNLLVSALVSPESYEKVASDLPAPCLTFDDTSSPKDVATKLSTLPHDANFLTCGSNIAISQSLAFGARGVVLSEDNPNLVQNLATMWGNKLLAASRMAIVSSGYKVSGVLDTLKSIVHMDNDLTLTAFNQTDSPSSPPMFLVANQDASSRTVQIEFNSSIVAGWSPMVGCAEAGFATCSNMVYGSNVMLDLGPYDAQMFYVTPYQGEKLL